jgi:hypothetical protein
MFFDERLDAEGWGQSTANPSPEIQTTNLSYVGRHKDRRFSPKGEKARNPDRTQYPTSCPRCSKHRNTPSFVS